MIISKQFDVAVNTFADTIEKLKVHWAIATLLDVVSRGTFTTDSTGYFERQNKNRGRKKYFKTDRWPPRSMYSSDQLLQIRPIE